MEGGASDAGTGRKRTLFTKTKTIMNPNDSAFPYDYTGDRGPSWGLTKREYIAIKMMAAIMQTKPQWGVHEQVIFATETADLLIRELSN